MSTLKQRAVPEGSQALSHDCDARDSGAKIFHDIFENAPVGYIVLGPDGQIRQINPSGAALLGEDEKALVGVWFGAFVADPDHREFISFLQRIFQSNCKEVCEIGINNRRERLLFSRIEGIASSDRQECRIVFSDVTESRIVQESMIFNESKYRALFENLSVAFSYHQIVTDSEGQVCDSVILEANNMYGSMLGKSLNELIGKKKSEVGLFRLSDDFEWRTLYQRGLATGQPLTFEYYSEALKQWFLIISFVPSPQHIAYIYLDTTDTKQKEQIIIESEKRYRSLVREANAIIMILNSVGEISFMNEFGLGFFGYRSEELIGRNIFGTIISIDAKSDKEPRQLFKNFQSKMAKHHRGLVESVTKAGHRVLVDWTVQECRDFIGEEARYVAVGIDAIDAKKSQRELEKQTERQRRRSLFNDAINRRISQSELVGAARQLGISLTPPYVVVLLDIGKGDLAQTGRTHDNVDRQGKLESLIEVLHPWDTGTAWKTREGVAVLRSMPESLERVSVKSVRSIADEMIKRVSQFGFSANEVHVGCAHSTHPMQSIADIYEQACAALSYGSVIHTDQLIHHWDELGFYQFIVKDLHTGMAQQFVQDQLGPLLQMNRTGAREELLETLKEIVSGNSAQLIAERLHIHRQTLVFRKKGLEKLLGVDLDSSEVVLNIAIALKMMSMSEQEQNQPPTL